MVTPGNTKSSAARYLIGDVIDIVADLQNSQGSYLVDARSSRRYLDCASYYASLPIGHNHQAMSNDEFEKKLLRAARVKPANSDFYTVELAEFVDSFASIAMPKNFKHLFFVEGGGLAVENALKAAFDWKVRKNLSATGRELGSQILHFKQAFHGRTGYTLSLTNTADARKTMYFPKFDWPRVMNPKITFPHDMESLECVEALEAASIHEIKSAFESNPDDIAAIIIEPIQGEGGDNHFREEFHQSLRKLADDYDALLIYDEVQTGVGLTGKMWAYEHYGMVPDLICFGKKTQVCGIMSTSRIDEVERNVFVESSRINSTWGGGLVDMVRFSRYLEIIRDEDLVTNAERVGRILLNGVGELAKRHPQLIKSARGKGLMVAFDMVRDGDRAKLIKELLSREMLILGCGTNSIRFRPALNFSETEVGEALGKLDDALKSLG